MSDAANGYTFNSQASPEEKKAQALSAAPPGLKTGKRNRGHEISNDLESMPALVMPAPTSEGKTEQPMENETATRIDSSVVGWEMAGGSSRQEFWELSNGDNERNNQKTQLVDEHNVAEHATFLEAILPPSAYGDWYHNTGVIIFCALTCWIVGRLGGGLSWILLILSICATYYRTSIRRVRRNVRDDISRKLAKTALETDTETTDWLNNFLFKFWIIYEPVLSATIVASVDQVLAASTPSMVESMRLASFTLGTKPPRIDHVKTYPKSEDDIVLMDWSFSFTPNDTYDLTARQMRNKINPKIELAIRAGTSLVAVNLPIVVEDIAFSGLMQVRIKLITEYPHIKIVDLSFLNKPDIEYVLKPLGGSTLGFDVGFIPGLSSWILDMIHATLDPMMYAPNMFTLNIQQMLSGAPIDSAIGVAVVTIHSCHGLRNPDIGSGKPDPYVTLSLGRGIVSRTETLKSETDPNFNESKTLLLTSLADSLILEVLDYNEVRKDRSLGIASFDLKSLEDAAVQNNLNAKLMANGKARGDINFSINWSPVLVPEKLADGSDGPMPESKIGIIRFTVHQAKNLGGSKNCNPYAILTEDSRELDRTARRKHTHNPVWDHSKEILVKDKDRCVLGVQIKNEERGSDAILGAYSTRLVDLLENTANEIDDFPLSQSPDPTAKIKISASWKPIASIDTTSRAYVPPIGALRVHFKKAINLRNPELGVTGGKADPYMRVVVKGEQRARTVTIKNEQSPAWNEIVYVPIRSAQERVVFEAMDHQNRTKDRSLGQIQYDIAPLVAETLYGASSTAKDRKEQSLQFAGKDAKGSLVCEVSFHSAISVMSRAEESEADASNEHVNHQRTVSTMSSTDNATDTTAGTLPTETIVHSSDGPTSNVAVASSQATIVKLRLSKDEVMQYNSGFLVIELEEGDLPGNGCYVQVLLDEYEFPAYTTPKSRSKHVLWNVCADGFVRELDSSQVMFRISKGTDASDQDDIIARAQENTLSLLRRSYNETFTQTLKDSDGNVSHISLRCRFIPVALQLDPRESINNMGHLRVNVISATNLCAADRGNKSDPYAKFYIDTQKECIYKTATVKKTLNPQWNESFEYPIRSLLDNILRIEIFDWDLADKDDFLGCADIPLSNLSPMNLSNLEVQIEGPKGGGGKSGTMSLQLLFKPSFVTRSKRAGTVRPGGTIKVFSARRPSGASDTAQMGTKSSSFLSRTIGVSRPKKDDTPRTDVGNDSILQVAEGPQRTHPSAVHTPNDSIDAAISSDAGVLSDHTIHDASHLQSTCYVRLLRGADFPEKKVVLRMKNSSGKTIGKTDPVKAKNPSFELIFTLHTNVNDDVEITMAEHNTFGPGKILSTAHFKVGTIASGVLTKIQLDNGASLELEIVPNSARPDETLSLKSARGLHLGGPFRRQPSNAH